MYINEQDQSLLARLYYHGPTDSGRLELLRALHDHFAARMGEHTRMDIQDFEPREELESSVGTTATAQLVTAAEKMFEAAYDELTESGTLVRMRTALDPLPGAYLRRIDAFAVTGHGSRDALRRHCLANADAVVFVADPRSERREATVAAWEELSSFNGPVVVLTIHSNDPDELALSLDVDGPRFAISDDFAGSLAAFETAAKLALEPFLESN